LPGGNSSGVGGVNADATVVVGGSNATGVNGEAYRWTAKTGMVGLGFLSGATDSAASGTSSDGSVVVGESGGKAFRWTAAGGMHSVKDLLTAAGVTAVNGWQLTRAVGVSADGIVISGQGIDPQGKNQGWIASLPRH
jgi:uncharacterized membrane protein